MDVSKCTNTSIDIGDRVAQASNCLRISGIYLDKHVTVETISSRNVGQLIHAFVHSQIDYRNALQQLTGLSKTVID